MTGWPPGVLPKEARRNFVSSGLRGTLLVVMFAISVGIPTFLEWQFLDRAVQLDDEFARKGGFVLITTSEMRFDTTTCLKINGVRGVTSVVALGRVGSVQFAKSPQTSFVAVPALGQLTKMFGALEHVSMQHEGVGDRRIHIGPAVAEELGLGAGDRAKLADNSEALVVSVLDTPGRAAFADRRVFIEGLGHHAQECWIEILPSLYEDARTAFPALFNTSPESRVSVVDGVPRNVSSRDSTADFSARPNRNLWVWTGAAAVLVVWAITWVRRDEIGLYRYLGLEAAGITILISLETMISAATGFVLAVGWCSTAAFVLLRALGPDQIAFGLLAGVSSLLVVAICAPIGIGLMSLRSQASLVKER